MPELQKTASPRQKCQPLVAIVGPTAVGKTGLVLDLAERLGAEVVNLDSMQVYRHMDIGTAKPTLAERREIRHHLLDLVRPDEEYNVARYVVDAEQCCAEIASRGRVPILTGGTGLYLKGFQEGLFVMAGDETPTVAEEPATATIRQTLQEDLREQGREALHARLAVVDPQSAARIHPNDTSRLLRALEVYERTGRPWSELLSRQKDSPSPAGERKTILKIGLMAERHWLYERINRRAGEMLRGGLINEVETLLGMGFGRELKPMQALGYRHVLEFIAGHWSQSRTLELLARDTRHYAKRQLTWFRRDAEITWFSPEQRGEITAHIERYLAGGQ